MLKHLLTILVGLLILSMLWVIPLELPGAESAARLTRSAPDYSPLPTPAPREVYLPSMVRRNSEATGDDAGLDRSIYVAR